VPKRARDPVTGQYAFDQDFERLCKCGHTLGVHIAGGFDCINSVEGDGDKCDCTKFRPLKKKG
jgi:hypothetical protein